MTAEDIIGLVIFGIVALTMIVIGIYQLNQEEPVGFYTGEKPPVAEGITDVKAWNLRHGIMWIIYGVLIIAGYFIGYFVGNVYFEIAVLIVFDVWPIILMMVYHSHLCKKYRRG